MCCAFLSHDPMLIKYIIPQSKATIIIALVIRMSHFHYLNIEYTLCGGPIGAVRCDTY